MAQQTKAEDPIAAAMSAIEDALNLSHGEAGVDVARPPKTGYQAPQGKSQTPAAEVFEPRTGAPSLSAEKPALSPQRPANL